MNDLEKFARREARKAAQKRGERWEMEIGEYLRGLGFNVELAKALRVFNGQRWITKNHDFFGCLDAIALHPGLPYMLPIQATTGMGALAQKKRDMQKVGWNLTASRPQIWIRGECELHAPIPVTIFEQVTKGSGWVPCEAELRPGKWIQPLR